MGLSPDFCLGVLSECADCRLVFRFQSKYHSQVVEESGAGKNSHLTMGEAEAYLAPPDRYLRKHTGTGGNHVRAKSARTHSKSDH